MKKNKKTLKEKFERKKEDYVNVRNSVKMEKKAIFHFIVRFLCSVIFIPFTIYFTVNLVAYGLMDYCILNDIGSLLIIVDTLYKVFNVLFWFVCFVLIFIYNYYMNIKAIGYSIVLKHNTMRRINPGVCPRCKSIIYNDVYMSKERVLDHYEKEIITETDWSGWRPKTREVYESTRPVYTTQDVEKNYQRCSNDGCGYEWKFKRVFADMPTVLWRLYTLEFPSKNNLSIKEISLGIKPFPDMYFIFKKSSRIKGFLSVIIVVFLVLFYIFNIDSRYQLTEHDIYGWLCFLGAFVLFSGAFQIYIHKQFEIKNCNGKKKCEEGISEEGAELLLKALAQVNCTCEKQDGKKIKEKIILDDDFNDEEKTKQTNDRLNEIISQTELKSKTFCGSKNPEVDLNSLIGLDNIKEELKNIIAEFEFDKKRAEQGISIEHNLGNHMMFLGAPGTGKTTVAHIMTGILYKYGYIKENKIVDINAADLTAQYTGWTKERTKQIINSAKGGVLFLDEAYILHSKNQLGNSYNEEATSVLVKEMEDNRSEFVVIIAGYKNETLEWINSNPGLRSRFTYTFEFQNYSEDDCCAIFKKIAKDNYFECSDKFMIYYKAYIKMLKSFGQTDFSLIGGNKSVPFQNARQPRVDFQKIKRYHSRNYYAYNYEEDITSLFVKEDAKCLDEMLWEKCGLPNSYIVYGNGENLPK